MADIPGANPDPTVQPERIPTPYNENRVSPETMGAGTGQELEQQGGERAKVGTAYQERANAVADEAAFGRAQSLLNSTILNEKTGFLGLKGQDALSQSDAFTQKYTDGIDQLRQGLTEAQWQRVGYRIDRLRESGLRIAASHEREQHNVIADATFRGAEKDATDALAQQLGDTSSTMPANHDSNRRAAWLGKPTEPEADSAAEVAFKALLQSGVNRATYKYGANPPPDAIKSETLPLLNAAAKTAMSEALSTGDAQHAARALEIFGPYLGVHAKSFTNAVATLQNETTIQHEVGRVLGMVARNPASLATLPDGSAMQMPDDPGFDKALLTLPDTKNAAEIRRRVNATRGEIDDGWKHTIQQQVLLARKEADPTAMGRIDVSLIDPMRRVFLRDHADEELTKLQNVQATQAKRDANGPQAQARRSLAFADAESIFGATRASDTTFREFLGSSSSIIGDDGKPLTLEQTLSPPDQRKFADAFEKKREKESADKPLSTDAAKQVIEGIAGAGLYPDPAVRGVAPSDDQIKIRNRVLDYVRTQRNAWQEANPKKEPGREDYDRWLGEEVGKVPGSDPHPWLPFSGGERSRVELDLQQEKAAQPSAQSLPLPPPPPQQTAAPQPKPALPSPPAGKVWMFKNGVRGAVPEAQKDAALKQGYTLE